MPSLMPTGKQQYFYTGTSKPLANGKVYTYAAGTSTLKTTWQDAAGTIPNTNPIVLDSTGSALIFWSGSYKVVVVDTNGNTISTVDNYNTDPQGVARLFSAIGSSLMGFIQAGANAVMQTVQDALRERVSVTQFMTAAQRADVQAWTKTLSVSDAVQKAVDFGGPNARIEYPAGYYRFDTSVTPQPGQLHIGYGATISPSANVKAFSRDVDGYPGRITFRRLRFEGTGNTGRAISMTNNTPLIGVEECYITGFDDGITLDGSYCSTIKGCHIVGNNFGIVLLNESHATLLDNNFVDSNIYGGLCINGDPVKGNRGANPIHNVTSIGGAYQRGQFGVWAENCYELHMVGVYHEGNTKADLRLGVGDGGVYARACYNFTIDGWQSSSACAAGKNVIIEHAVCGSLRGMAFNGGTSTVATLLSVDGFSDQIELDYRRVQTAAFSAGIPFNVPAGRVIISRNGRRTIPWTLKAISFGALEQVLGNLWGTYTGGGRPMLQLEAAGAIGSGMDMCIKVADIERHYDGAGVEQMNLDHLNRRMNVNYIVQPMTDNTLALGGSTNRWQQLYAGTATINTSDEREKQDIEAIPQAWLDAWGDVQFVRFRFRDAVATKGDGARWHVGLIAQRVKDAFEAHGLDPFEIGVLCYDEWQESTDVDGKHTAAGNRYGIRYEEALVLECAWLRSRLPH